MAETAAHLVDHVLPHVGVRQWVLSFPLPIRYLLLSNAKLKRKMLSLTMKVLHSYLSKKAKVKKKHSEIGAVTLIQHFGGSVNANPHFHMIVCDGVYVENGNELKFVEVDPPTDEEVKAILVQISKQVLYYLSQKGYYTIDENLFNWEEDPFLEEEPTLASCLGASIRYRIALGERAGEQVRRLGYMAECLFEEANLSGSRCAELGGFSLHADVAAKANEREKLETICRYVSRPPVATERLTERPNGELLYKLKKKYHDGTEFLIFSKMEFLEKLSALVPKPNTHLTIYHGVLAPHSKWRRQVVPKKNQEDKNGGDTSTTSRTRRMSWAALLKRVFNIDVKTCPHCQGEMKVISAILDKETITKILTHLGLPTEPPPIAPARSPPQQDFGF